MHDLSGGSEKRWEPQAHDQGGEHPHAVHQVGHHNHHDGNQHSWFFNEAYFSGIVPV